tara:strand:- start:1155 stop:1943 length:789 start_codon:yes stop_codon:yes gene_type:complete
MSLDSWLNKYKENKPISVLTAYDAALSRLLEISKIDGILVGDSLRHTFFGDSTTTTATIEDMIYHTKAVKNGAPNTFIIADMPYMSYHNSIDEALSNAQALIEAGAHAVKCETLTNHLPTVKKMIQTGIPVMAHLGLQPQYLTDTPDYSVRGSSKEDQHNLLTLSSALADLGVFSIVLEKVPMSVAKTITETVHCPTIGIGAGPHCSGQVLVTNDLLGLTPNFSPKFVKKYLDGHSLILEALTSYKTDVESGIFPTKEQGYE